MRWKAPWVAAGECTGSSQCPLSQQSRAPTLVPTSWTLSTCYSSEPYSQQLISVTWALFEQYILFWYIYQTPKLILKSHNDTKKNLKSDMCLLGFPGGTKVKNPSANAGNTRNSGLIPGLGRPLGVRNGNLLQYSCIQSTGSKRVRHDWVIEHTHTCLLGVLSKTRHFSPLM